MHEIVQELVSCNPAPDPLAEDPQRNGQSTDREETTSQHIEDCKNTVLLQPVVDEIDESEGKQVSLFIVSYGQRFCQA